MSDTRWCAPLHYLRTRVLYRLPPNSFLWNVRLEPDTKNVDKHGNLGVHAISYILSKCEDFEAKNNFSWAFWRSKQDCEAADMNLDKVIFQ